METKKIGSGQVSTLTGKKEVIKGTPNEEIAGKPDKKRRRKHISASEAVSKIGSIVDQANARSSGDVDYGNTGTNLT